MNACIESCEHILFPLNLYQWSCGYSSFSFSMYILLHFQLPFYFLWWKNSVELRKFCVLRWPFFFAISRFSKLIVPTKLQFFIFRIKRFLFLFFSAYTVKNDLVSKSSDFNERLECPFHLDLVIPFNSVSHAQSRRFAPSFVAVETYKQTKNISFK